MMRYAWPLGIFIALVIFLGLGLKLKPSEVPSPLIGKPAPFFNLPELQAPEKMLSSKDLLGKVWLLNVWASWCAACSVEHPLLVELSQAGGVPIYGLDYKDNREEGLSWLQDRGNPYTAIASDADGRVGIDFGVYGVPETFVIDRQGVIRYKQIGPLTADILANKIMPLVRELQK